MPCPRHPRILRRGSRFVRCTLYLVLCTSGSAAGGATLERATLEDAHDVRAAFLSRAVGARPAGMGEAFVAVADDASAIAWNPAGLGQLDGISAVAAHDVAGHGLALSHLSTAIPVGPGVAGAGVWVMDYGSCDVRDVYGVKTGTENPVDVAVSGSYGFRNPAFAGVGGWTGLSLGLVRESLGGASIGVGAGTVIPVAASVRLGLAVRHVGLKGEGGSLPVAAHTGVAWTAAPGLGLALDGGYGLVDGSMSVALGSELVAHETVVLRAGYKLRTSDRGLEGPVGFTLGAGLRVGRIGLDYAFQPFGDLSTTHKVSIQYRSRRGSGLAGRDVEAAYQEAADLYMLGEYRPALARAQAIVKAAPAHWRAWSLAGNCLYAERDPAGALEAYEKSLKINPDNPDLAAWVERLKEAPPGR